MEQMTSLCDMVGQIMQKKEEERRIAEEWNGYLRKRRKTKPKRQNRTQNGKDCERQSQIKAEKSTGQSQSQPKSTPKPKSQQVKTYKF
ncbi:hypothetical protein Tco_0045867 [Tanacetum coccineum]